MGNWKEELRNANWKAIVGVCIAILFAFLLYRIEDVLHFLALCLKAISPIFFGIFFVHIVLPIEKGIAKAVPFKKKKKLAKGISLGISTVLISSAIVLACAVVIPRALSSAVDLFESLKKANELPIHPVLQRIAIQFSLKNSVEKLVIDNYETVFSISQSAAGTVVNVAVGFIIAIYFSAEKEKIMETVKLLYEKAFRKEFGRTFTIVKKCSELFSKYLMCTIIDAMIIGIANAIFMAIVGYKNIALVSSIVGITNVVPTFGPMFGGVIGFVILFINGTKPAIWWLIFTVVIQIIDGYVIKPKLFGDAMGLSPFLTLLTIVIGGKAFGPWGVILSIPFVAMAHVIRLEIRDIERAKKGAEEEIRTEMIARLETTPLKSPWRLSLGKATDNPFHLGYFEDEEEGCFIAFKNGELENEKKSYKNEIDAIEKAFEFAKKEKSKGVFD